MLLLCQLVLINLEFDCDLNLFIFVTFCEFCELYSLLCAGSRAVVSIPVSSKRCSLRSFAAVLKFSVIAFVRVLLVSASFQWFCVTICSSVWLSSSDTRKSIICQSWRRCFWFLNWREKRIEVLRRLAVLTGLYPSASTFIGSGWNSWRPSRVHTCCDSLATCTYKFIGSCSALSSLWRDASASSSHLCSLRSDIFSLKGLSWQLANAHSRKGLCRINSGSTPIVWTLIKGIVKGESAGGRLWRLNTDENRSKRRKKPKGFDLFWRSKTDENRRFLMFDSDEILKRGRWVVDLWIVWNCFLVDWRPFGWVKLQFWRIEDSCEEHYYLMIYSKLTSASKYCSNGVTHTLASNLSVRRRNDQNSVSV